MHYKDQFLFIIEKVEAIHSTIQYFQSSDECCQRRGPISYPFLKPLTCLVRYLIPVCWTRWWNPCPLWPNHVLGVYVFRASGKANGTLLWLRKWYPLWAHELEKDTPSSGRMRTLSTGWILVLTCPPWLGALVQGTTRPSIQGGPVCAKHLSDSICVPESKQWAVTGIQRKEHWSWGTPGRVKWAIAIDLGHKTSSIWDVLTLPPMTLIQQTPTQLWVLA